jgi:hypothetical protein
MSDGIKPEGRGGARKGAGRPKLPDDMRKSTITVRIKESTLRTLKSVTKERERGAFIESAIETALANR